MILFRDETRNNLCTEKQFVRDAFCGKDASLYAKTIVQGCIRGEEIIPVVKKSKPGMNPEGRNNPCGTKSKPEMNPGGRNNPCRTKEHARDESGRKKSSLRKKRARQGCIREEEIIPAEEKSKLGMNPEGRNNPCGTKEQDRDESGRKK